MLAAWMAAGVAEAQPKAGEPPVTASEVEISPDGVRN
jgi:hypothetical protein